MIRNSTLLVVVAAVVVSVAVVARDCVGPRPVPDPPPEGEKDFPLLQPPDERVTLLLERIRARDEALRRLIAGEARLAEVTALFLRLHIDDDQYLPTVAKAYPAPTPTASVARSVIRQALMHLLDDPGRRAEVMTRLEAEYEAEHGPVGPTRGE